MPGAAIRSAQRDAVADWDVPKYLVWLRFLRARLRVPCEQPNALLGARSNAARIAQRGPHMLLAGDGLRSARTTMPLLPQATENKPTHTVTKMASTAGEKKGGVDIQLIIYFALWYLGNYYYNISNKMALKAAGTLPMKSPVPYPMHVQAASSACTWHHVSLLEMAMGKCWQISVAAILSPAEEGEHRNLTEQHDTLSTYQAARLVSP
jgi:hypothetical protein